MSGFTIACLLGKNHKRKLSDNDDDDDEHEHQLHKRQTIEGNERFLLLFFFFMISN